MLIERWGLQVLGKLAHSMLGQFTQLQKWVPDCRQRWYLCVRAV